MDYTLKQAVAQLSLALGRTHDGDIAAAAEAAGIAAALLTDLAGQRVAFPNDYQTETVVGYETAIGYAVGLAPGLVSLIPDLSVFVADEAALSKRALEAGCMITTVKAPRALERLGHATCLAFPVHVLRSHYDPR